jgi:hypothetical protein
MARVEIPAPDEGAVKPWRKRLQGLDETAHGGAACAGQWLEAGAAYDLPVGALVVLCDPHPGGGKKRVRVWRVKRDGTVKVERDSTLGSANAFGASVRGTLRRLLEKHPAQSGTASQLTAAPPRVNTREDFCLSCRQPVPAGAGVLVRVGQQYSKVQHKPGECPPPPVRRNEWAQGCGLCGGWLEEGEGVLYNAGSADVPVTRARHPEKCPPREERKAAPPRPNRKAQDCDRCGNLVGAFDGELLQAGAGWIVRHRAGECPAREELWQIDRGVPGRFNPRPEQWRPAGTVLRSKVYEGAQPFPETAPGYYRVGDGVVSAIVTTVRERRPEYCRDEDGNNPSSLIGEDGWWFRILVRPATAEEAAGILAAEEKAARRADLERRRRALFSYTTGDGEVPDVDDLGDVQQVNFGAKERRTLHQHWPDDELHVDEAAGVVWYLEYNGADGDDWSRNNWRGGFIARRFPLTEERRTLIADLRAEYGSA